MKFAFGIGRHELALVAHAVVARDDHSLIEERHVITDRVQEGLSSHVLVSDQTLVLSERRRTNVSDDGFSHTHISLKNHR